MKFKALLSAVFFVIAAAVARGEIIEQILVKVNGDIFTKTDLEQRQIAALRQKGQTIDLKSDPNNVQLRKALDEVTDAASEAVERRDNDHVDLACPYGSEKPIEAGPPILRAGNTLVEVLGRLPTTRRYVFAQVPELRFD